MQAVSSSKNYASYQTKINPSQNPPVKDVKDMGRQKHRIFRSSITHGKQIKDIYHSSSI